MLKSECASNPIKAINIGSTGIAEQISGKPERLMDFGPITQGFLSLGQL